MRSLPFNDADVARDISEHIWRYLSPASSVHDLELSISALTQLEPEDIRRLGRIHFILSEEVNDLLDDLPRLMRRLATATSHEEEWRPDRVRGPIAWGQTYAARAATGLSTMHVTMPVSRAFQTPENQLLVHVLRQIVEQGRYVGWAADQTREKPAVEFRRRIGEAEHGLSRRRLSEVDEAAPTPRQVARVRTGRHRRDYDSALRTYELLVGLVRRADVEAVRDAVNSRVFIAAGRGKLFELLCLIRILEALERRGWRLEKLRLIEGALRLRGVRESSRLVLHYEQPPRAFKGHSRYSGALRAHTVRARALRPDFTVQLSAESGTTWTMFESKQYRKVSSGARASLRDLLAYRRAFSEVLDKQPAGVYGIGLVWGGGLEPKDGSDVALTTPDHIEDALDLVGL